MTPGSQMSHQVRLAGTDGVFACEESESILEGAERAGFALPYSCRKGVCTTCAAPLLAGSVHARNAGAVRAPADELLLCQAKPRSDVEVAPTQVYRRVPPQRRTMSARVVSLSWPAPDVAELKLRFPTGRRVPFTPGQYLRLLFDGESRSYSLANPPQNCDGAVIHVRRVPGGRFSDEYLQTLAVGSSVTVELPYGQASPAPGPQPLLVLVTGTGVAPALSIVTDQIRRADERPLHLYWGGRYRRDLYAAGRLAQWAATHAWLHVTLVVSRPEPDWRGATGWVQDTALKEHSDLSGFQAIACGNPAMVDAARAALVDQCGLDRESFRADPFVATGDGPMEPAGVPAVE